MFLKTIFHERLAKKRNLNKNYLTMNNILVAVFFLLAGIRGTQSSVTCTSSSCTIQDSRALSLDSSKLFTFASGIRVSVLWGALFQEVAFVADFKINCGTSTQVNYDYIIPNTFSTLPSCNYLHYTAELGGVYSLPSLTIEMQFTDTDGSTISSESVTSGTSIKVENDDYIVTINSIALNSAFLVGSQDVKMIMGTVDTGLPRLTDIKGDSLMTWAWDPVSYGTTQLDEAGMTVGFASFTKDIDDGQVLTSNPAGIPPPSSVLRTSNSLDPSNPWRTSGNDIYVYTPLHQAFKLGTIQATNINGMGPDANQLGSLVNSGLTISTLPIYFCVLNDKSLIPPIYPCKSNNYNPDNFKDTSMILFWNASCLFSFQQGQFMLSYQPIEQPLVKYTYLVNPGVLNLWTSATETVPITKSTVLLEPAVKMMFSTAVSSLIPDDLMELLQYIVLVFRVEISRVVYLPSGSSSRILVEGGTGFYIYIYTPPGTEPA
jgi:hypothetical protein